MIWTCEPGDTDDLALIYGHYFVLSIGLVDLEKFVYHASTLHAGRIRKHALHLWFM